MTTPQTTPELLAMAQEAGARVSAEHRPADDPLVSMDLNTLAAFVVRVTAAPQEGVSDEQSVFEEWLDRTRPSGDVESVQRQWEQSSEYRDFHAAPESPQPLAPPPGWKMLTMDEIDEVFERPRAHNAFVYQAKDLIDAFIAKNSAPPGRGMVPMTTAEIDLAVRNAQIAFCLDKFKTFEEALVRKAEAHHGIKEGSATPLGDGEGAR